MNDQNVDQSKRPNSLHGKQSFEEPESGYGGTPSYTAENSTPERRGSTYTVKPHSLSDDSSTSEMPVPQQPVPVDDDTSVQCSPSLQHPNEVTYVEELMAEYPSANIAFMGRPMSMQAGDESMLMENDSSTPVLEAQDETPFQQESQTGAGLPATMMMPKNNIFPVKAEGDIVTGTKNRTTAATDNGEKADKICDAVHDYYTDQFVDHWKKKTKEGSSTITIIAALLVEKNSKFKVVILTAGNKIKQKCSYFFEGSTMQDSNWGLCDGHAVAVCYRLANLYLITEMYKLHEGDNSIFTVNAEGYVLKSDIKFHLFTSQLPCGFMTTEESHFLSWKRPFMGKPHNLECSSIILIAAYLGIQGSLSHVLARPVYISSITIPRYGTVHTLQDSCIKEKFKKI